nr:hypothetical protein [Fodinicola feengrottensis]
MPGVVELHRIEVDGGDPMPGGGERGRGVAGRRDRQHPAGLREYRRFDIGVLVHPAEQQPRTQRRPALSHGPAPRPA